jgi:5-methylcytosine-specific restriction enzyme subunit McrC
VSGIDPSQHRVLTVVSRGSVELPLSEVMTEGHIDVLPHVEARGLLFLQFRRGKLTITAGKYVGVIPLTRHISIDVRPKLPVSNLAHVLDRARSSLQTLNPLERFYGISAEPGTTVLEFLLRNLVDALTPVRSNGLLKDYIRQTQISSQPRGHINISASLQASWSKGQKYKASVERFEQTTDIAPNRLIKHALEYALGLLVREGCDRQLLAKGNEAFREFPSQITTYRSSDYAICHTLVHAQKLPAPRSYYYRPLEIALLILSQRSISLDAPGNDVALQAFILDFEDVFECYLRRVLELRAPTHLAVRDGNGDGKKSLYDDRADTPAQPDIVLQSPMGTPVIAEVKYKEKPDRGDINQAITYAVSYRTDTAVLVHQSRPTGPHGLYHIGTVNGIRLDGYGFNLAAENLVAEEVAFANALFAMTPNQTAVTLVA